jgi:broad specificity phosphatase PhoE
MEQARLILIRHGHTAANSGGEPRMSGWTDFPLSPFGRRQAEALSRRLAAGEPSASRLYTSPLQRAADTARALAAVTGGDLVPEEDLREIGCGEVDGWTVSAVREHYPHLWEANFRQHDPDFGWPGGETYRNFRERCLSGMRRIAAAHPGERVLVVTHAGLISQVIGWLQGLGPESWERFRPGNCSLTEVLWREDCGSVAAFDDRSHLAGVNPEAEARARADEAAAAVQPGANTCPPSG